MTDEQTEINVRELLLAGVGDPEQDELWWDDDEDDPIGGRNLYMGSYLDDSEEPNHFSSDWVDPVPHLYSGKWDVDPFNQINDRLITGGDWYQTERPVLDALLRRGVTHILDCRTQWELERAASSQTWTSPQLHAEFATNLGDDDGRKKTVHYFRFAMQWAERVLQIPDSVMFVHCAMGINRGPSNAYAILRGPMQQTQIEALTNIRKVRDGARVLYAPDADTAVSYFYGRNTHA